MVFASSISPERRAGLRRLRAEFEAAFDAMDGDRDPASPAFRAADARYRAWIAALDAVALALLDDVDAFEAQHRDRSDDHGRRAAAGPSPIADPAPADVDRLFSDLDDLRRSIDLIGTAPNPTVGGRDASMRARAMGVVGLDRVARHWTVRLGGNAPCAAAERLRSPRTEAAV